MSLFAKLLLYGFGFGLTVYGVSLLPTLIWWKMLIGVFNIGWGASIFWNRKELLDKNPIDKKIEP